MGFRAITSDCHGDFQYILDYASRNKLTSNDTIIVLGDDEINSCYDNVYQNILMDLPCTLFCIHGNHQPRAETLPNYKKCTIFGGIGYMDMQYPNIIFAKDGEIYNIDNKKCMVIGGAYSVDKFLRLYKKYPWFPDEQPDDKIKKYCEKQLNKNNWSIDYMFTHTCPYDYRPTEWFLESLSTFVHDVSTEEWLQRIYDKLNFKIWYCGHFHGNKYDENSRIRFIYKEFCELGGI